MPTVMRRAGARSVPVAHVPGPVQGRSATSLALASAPAFGAREVPVEPVQHADGDVPQKKRKVTMPGLVMISV